MYTIVIVDDQRDYCYLVREILKPYEGFRVIGEAHNGAQALSLVQELGPNVALIDVSLPDMSGFQVAERLYRQFPSTKVLMMSASEESEYKRQARMVGALDFVPKFHFVPENIYNALASGVGSVQG